MKSFKQFNEDKSLHEELPIASSDIAKDLKNTLKKQFPKTKFKVNTIKGGSSSSINIMWNDGASLDAVELITNKFHKAKRNEKTGEIIYSGNQYTKTVYINTERDVSDKAIEKLVDVYNSNVEETNRVDSNGIGQDDKRSMSNSFKRVMHSTDFDKPLSVKLKGFQYIGNSVGNR